MARSFPFGGTGPPSNPCSVYGATILGGGVEEKMRRYRSFAELEATRGRHLLRDATPEFRRRRLGCRIKRRPVGHLWDWQVIQPNVDIPPAEGLGSRAR